MPRAFAALAAVLACAATSLTARADVKEACIAASEDAQQLRIDGKPLEARTRLLDCAKPECPALVRQDCAQWMADVVSSIPTVVLGARDAQGRDVIEVKASVDGVPVAGRLDGRSVDVDPGVHAFRFDATGAGGGSVELQVLVRAGEKNREITVTLSPAAPAPAELPGAIGPAHPGGRPLAWIFGGVALAALGTALAFDVLQATDYAHLDATCAGHCSPAEVNHVATERWIAGIAAGVGALSLGAGGYFFFVRPSPAAGVSASLGTRF